MASERKFEALARDICTKATKEAFTEIDAEDLATTNGTPKTTGSTPTQLSVWGRWNSRFPLPCPDPASRTEMFMMTPKWGKYLPAPRSFCDVATMHVRDVSLTKRWLQCEPEMEDLALRRKYGERVDAWRNLITTSKTETYIPGVFKYKSTTSLLDTICPVRKTKSDSFEIIDLKDIIPEIVIDLCGDVVEVTSEVACEDKPLKGGKVKKQRKRRFLCCFGK